jgi:Trk-type K+ transport system membrane component
MVIFEFLRAHSDFVLLSVLAFLIWYRHGRDITVSDLFRHEFNKFILVVLVVFFVAVTVYAEQHASKLAEAMLDLIKTVVGALLILINSKQQPGDPSSQAQAPPTPPAQGGA